MSTTAVPAPAPSSPAPLGNNLGGYFGDRIDIAPVLRDASEAAANFGWTTECFLSRPGLELVAFHRAVRHARAKIYLSTGIHGDEPAGPLAMRQLLQENAWPQGIALWVCPCLNPTGFPLNRRENAQGNDVNRDYQHLLTDEARAHAAWLDRQPQFDLTLCLHEDWEAKGFYLYELNPDGRPSLAEVIIREVSKVCPIDPSEVIEERAARNGIIRPNLDPTQRPRWPEAFYLIRNKTRQSYTLEAPSDFPLATRVAALVAAVRAALAEIPR